MDGLETTQGQEPAEIVQSNTPMSVEDFHSGGIPEGSAQQTPPVSSEPTTQTQEQPQGQTPSLRDYVTALGLDLGPEATDDTTILNGIISRARSYEQLARERQAQDVYTRLGQQLAPRAAELNDFLNGRQAQTQPEAPKPWQPPRFDERWINLVERDERTGVYISKPGVPPEVAQNVNAYVDWQNRFQRDPASVLEPLVNERMAPYVQQAVSQALAQERERVQLEQISRQNSEWFYAKDASGQYLVDPITQQPIASPQGREYLGYVEYGRRQLGISNPLALNDLALRLMGSARQQQAAATQGGPPTPAQQRALVSAQQNRNPLQALGSVERNETPSSTEPAAASMTIRQLLSEGFAQNGITDNDISLPG